MMRTLGVTAGLVCWALAVFLVSGPATAQKSYPRWAGGEVQIRGYDTTAYFKRGAPVAGNTGNVVKWNGGTWRFQTVTEADTFRDNPSAYTPQFGAYCTGGLSQQHVVDGNPTIWRMHKGKLYLFYGEGGGQRFDKDPDGVIAAARAYAAKVGIREN